MANWEEEIKNHYEKILKKNNLDKINFSINTSWFYKIIFACISGILALICFLCLEFNFYIIWHNWFNFISNLCYIIYYYSCNKKPDLSKFEKLIINSLDFPYYYFLAHLKTFHMININYHHYQLNLILYQLIYQKREQIKLMAF